MLLNYFRKFWSAILKLMGINTAGVQFSSSLNYDQVIYATTRTLSLTENAVATQINSGINQQGLPLGIFSIDNGTTWNDMGAPLTYGTGVTGIFLSVNCTSNGTINLRLVTQSGSSTYTVLIKLVLLASDTPSELPNSVVSTTNPTAYQFGTDANYRYIIDTNTQSLTNATEYTYAHNQDAIPIIQNWTIQSGAYYLYGLYVDARWTNPTFLMDDYVIAYETNNVYFGQHLGITISTYWRVYQQ